MLNTYPLAKDLQVLVEIVHSGSFSAAAATLGQTPAFVTKRRVVNVAMNMRRRSSRAISIWSMTSRNSKRARQG